MPYPIDPNDYRNQIADQLTPPVKPNTPLSTAMSAIPQMGQMPTAMPSGMPQTPAGGVPGSGLAPAGSSIVPTPPPRGGMMGAMQPMGTRGMAGPIPQAPPPSLPLGGLGDMSQMGVDQMGMMPAMNRRGMGRMRGY